MAATFRASTGATSISGTSHVGNKPAGTADGDALLAGLIVDSGRTVTAPSGWSLDYESSAFGSRKLHVFKKRASSEGASWTWSTDLNTGSVLQVVAVQGNDQTTLIDASGGQSNASSTSVASPTINPSADNGCLVGFFAGAGNVTFLAASGMTERHDQVVNADRAEECATQDYGSPGGSVQKTATASSAVANAAWIGYVPEPAAAKGAPLYFGTT